CALVCPSARRRSHLRGCSPAWGMLQARPADGEKGADIDRWEEGFDSWTPRRGTEATDDTGADLDREVLLRLARELAQKRHAELEAHVERIEQRELELATELAQAQAQLHDSLSERELASAERAKLEERAEEARRVEKELAARRIELELERERLEARAREVEARTRALETIAAEPQEPRADPDG